MFVGKVCSTSVTLLLSNGLFMNTVKVSCFVTKPEQKEAATAAFVHFLYCQLFDADIKEQK